MELFDITKLAKIPYINVVVRIYAILYPFCSESFSIAIYINFKCNFYYRFFRPPPLRCNEISL